jgi:hypothetical protein
MAEQKWNQIPPIVPSNQPGGQVVAIPLTEAIANPERVHPVTNKTYLPPQPNELKNQLGGK